MLTELTHITPVLNFKEASNSKDASLRTTCTVSILPFRSPRLDSGVNLIRSMIRSVDQLRVFTKRANFNKLYVGNDKGLFLSAGIILKFMKKDEQRFLKKRLRTWHNYVKALSMLQVRPFVLHFADLFGKKAILLSKISSSKVRVRWLFIRLFFTDFRLGTRRARRVKRWIKKKYYQLGVGEKR